MKSFCPKIHGSPGMKKHRKARLSDMAMLALTDTILLRSVRAGEFWLNSMKHTILIKAVRSKL
jgi:hypothetical protein